MAEMPSLDDYRTRLLTSLGRLLEQRPLLDITIADIVREARMSKRTFYEKFANKEECFLALYHQHGALLLDTVRAAVDVPELLLAQRVERGCRTYLATLAAQARLLQRLYIDIQTLGPQGMRVRRAVGQQFTDLIAGLIESDRSGFPGLVVDSQMLMCLVAGIAEIAMYRIEDDAADSLLELCPTLQRLLAGALHAMTTPAAAAAPVTV